jgi:hypothetical protein
MFRVSRNDDVEEPVINVDTVAQNASAIRSQPPGRWQIDELAAKPFPSGDTARRWGIGTKRDDGSVVIKPDRWP